MAIIFLKFPLVEKSEEEQYQRTSLLAYSNNRMGKRSSHCVAGQDCYCAGQAKDFAFHRKSLGFPFFAAHTLPHHSAITHR
ncbi:hypothetical protein [Undibacterium sp. WLHG33]|uniref:hypothetical protein n=1 Tax=Undibacterium sp. WLHG33 TaxID=3412482 RepID=UPI003C2FB637